MKILFFHHSDAFGGSTTSLLFTIQELQKRNHECSVCLCRPYLPITEYFEKKQIKVFNTNKITLWHHNTAVANRWYNRFSYKLFLFFPILVSRTSIEMDKIIQIFKPDLVHLNSQCFALATFHLNQASIPFVWHFREHPPKLLLDPILRINRFIQGRIIKKNEKKCIFISKADRNAWTCNQFGIVVYNFIDLEKFSPQHKNHEIANNLGIAKKDFVLLFVGGPRKIKGIFILFKTIKLLSESNIPIKVLMPGMFYPLEGWKLLFARKLLPCFGLATPAQKIEQILQSSPYKSVCIPCEYQEDITQFLNICDALVFPATVPHFSRPAIEASAMAKPVIASDLDGIRELVLDNETGLLVKPNSVTSLYNAIVKLKNDTNICLKFGENGRKHSSNTFASNISVDNLISIYSRIL